YVLRASYAPASWQGGDAVVVSLSRAGLRPPPDAVLRERFGLTAREIGVARLLAHGRGNAEIARELYVSEATARTHTQRILGKLGVARRAQVAAALLAAAPAPR
ncbi:MAG TPA: LuxR C-terminal-related transcriptional regulator, partial [Longimicrobium sp.]|uniref:response regulator transcription factor n=1 Tax=Longimicrobium sp. TaxID=2029185 RepID=UPI002EDBA528